MGAVLPPQVLYINFKENTEHCCTQLTSSAEWDVWHTPNYKSNEKKMLTLPGQGLNIVCQNKTP